MVKVKLCGIRSLEGARACRKAAPDWVGLNFVPTSKRKVSVEEARKLLPELGAIPAVGVFMNQPLEEIEAIAQALSLSWIQLHGGEPPEFCEALEHYKVIKAFSLEAGFDAALLERYRSVELFLFDAARAGSGTSFDWNLLPRIPEHSFLLAGGLHPENVGAAIRRVHPLGVDTASGIEQEGREDPESILRFCRNARLSRS